jgi:hypothetical protein
MTASPKDPPRGIKMDKDMKQMAMALYPNVPPKEAYKLWANGAGKKMVEGDRHDR